MITKVRCALGSILALAAVACGAVSSPHDDAAFREGTARSPDGVEIHYVEGGQGAIALVFVHGWLADAGVWDSAMRRFAPEHRVVALDLAGHGRSGRGRTDWTVERFAGDVACVVEALDLRHAVLVGHSMSGPIAVAAANALPGRIHGVVPVDTLIDVEWVLPPDVAAQFFGGLRADFPNAVEDFFKQRLAAPGSPQPVIEAIVAKARVADPALAVPMLERSVEFDSKSALKRLAVPIHAVNSDLSPTNLDVNRKYAPHFEVEVITGVGHWPHLEDPQRFEDALAKVLAALDRG